MKKKVLAGAVAAIGALALAQTVFAVGSWIGFYYPSGGSSLYVGGSRWGNNEYCNGYLTNVGFKQWNYIYTYSSIPWVTVSTWEAYNGYNSNPLISLYWAPEQQAYDHYGYRARFYPGVGTPFSTNLYYYSGYAFQYSSSQGRWIVSLARFGDYQLSINCQFDAQTWIMGTVPS